MEYIFKQITEEQSKKYVENEGGACPFCGSQSIEGDKMEFDSGRIEQLISCNDCDQQWWDIYKLVQVASDETPKNA